MTSKRLFFVLTGILVFLIGLGVAGTVYGNSFMEKETGNIIDLKVENLALDEQQRSLVQAKKDIQKYTELESIAKSIVPQEKDQARTVREIIRLAQQSGIPVASISFPSSNLGQAPVKSVAPAPESPGSASPTPAATPSIQATQVKPVEGITGVYQLEINVQSDSNKSVRYENLLNFLSLLEKNRRTAHITNLTVTPATNDRNRVVFNLTVNAYIKP